MRTLGISGALKAPSAGSLVKSALRLPSDVLWSHESGLEYLPEACGTAERFLYCEAVDEVPCVTSIWQISFGPGETTPGGGEFTITINGQETAGISYDEFLTDVVLQAALDDLIGIDVTVSGSVPNFELEFNTCSSFAVRVDIGTSSYIVPETDPVETLPATVTFEQTRDFVPTATVWAEKLDSSTPDDVQFRPFVIYYPEGCGTLALRPTDWEARAVAGLTAQESAALALELNSSYNGINPDLLSTAENVSPIDPNAIPQTIFGLIHSMVDCGYSGDITFHVPAWALPSFLKDTELTLVNGVYKLGHHTVIFDAGYTNQAPDSAFIDNIVASDSDVWIYATTPVEYAFDEVRTYGTEESMKGNMARQNASYVVAERPAIVRFDTCCVFAALATVCR